MIETPLAYPDAPLHRPWETERLDGSTLRWLQSLGIVADDREARTLLKIQPGKLAAYTFGYGTEERLELCAHLIGWFFCFDDRYPDGMFRSNPRSLANVYRRFDSILEGAACEPDEPFADGLDDLYRRLRRMAPRHWVDRFSRSIRYYFWGCEQETLCRQSRRPPDLNQYFGFRPCSFGIYQMFDLIELAREEFITDALALSPWFEQVRRHAGVVLSIAGDIYSAPKESLEDNSYNTVAVLMQSRLLSLDEALRATIALHEEELARYLRAEAELTSRFRESVPILDGLRTWFSGNQAWSRECPRYNQAAT